MGLDLRTLLATERSELAVNMGRGGSRQKCEKRGIGGSLGFGRIRPRTRTNAASAQGGPNIIAGSGHGGIGGNQVLSGEGAFFEGLLRTD